jgi:hypothetical protein
MKHLKKYEDWGKVNEEEALRDWLAGAGLLIGTMFGNPAQSQTKKGDPINKKVDTVYYQTKDTKQMKQHLKQGWQLNRTEMDTVWKTIVENAPDTLIETSTIEIDNDAYFASGRFGLSEEVKAEIRSEMDEIAENGGTIIGVKIVSSTDKTPLSKGLANNLKNLGYTGDNPGLSMARNNSVRTVIEDYGFNGENIESTLLSEQGSIDDPSARFVKVHFVSAYIKQEITPSVTKTVPVVTPTYHMSKEVKPVEFKKIDKKKVVHLHRKNSKGSYIKKRKHKIGRADSCPKGSMGGWWRNLGF